MTTATISKTAVTQSYNAWTFTPQRTWTEMNAPRRSTYQWANPWHQDLPNIEKEKQERWMPRLTGWRTCLVRRIGVVKGWQRQTDFTEFLFTAENLKWEIVVHEMKEKQCHGLVPELETNKRVAYERMQKYRTGLTSTAENEQEWMRPWKKVYI